MDVQQLPTNARDTPTDAQRRLRPLPALPTLISVSLAVRGRHRTAATATTAAATASADGESKWHHLCYAAWRWRCRSAAGRGAATTTGLGRCGLGGRWEEAPADYVRPAGVARHAIEVRGD